MVRGTFIAFLLKLVSYLYCRSPFPSQQFKCCEPGCEVRFFLLEDLSLHYRSFHREAALLEWLNWWDHIDYIERTARRMGRDPSASDGFPPPHPHWGAQPPEPGYCSRVGRALDAPIR